MGFGVTPLFMAAGDNRVEVVKLLLAAGADPNARCWLGRTPLHWVWDSPEVVEVLLAAGALLDAETNKHRNAFVEAVIETDHAKAVQLASLGCDVSGLRDLDLVAERRLFPNQQEGHLEQLQRLTGGALAELSTAQTLLNAEFPSMLTDYLLKFVHHELNLTQITAFTERELENAERSPQTTT